MTRAVRAATAAALLVGLVGCAGGPASPSPPGFVEIFGELARRGATVTDVVSGDPGCDDATLVPNAVKFRLRAPSGAIAEVYLFVFTDRTARERSQPRIDACFGTFSSRLPAGTNADSRPFGAYAAMGTNLTPEVESLLADAVGTRPETP